MSFYELGIMSEFCPHWIQMKIVLYLKRHLAVKSKYGNVSKHMIFSVGMIQFIIYIFK